MAGFVPSDPWTRRYLLISWRSVVEDIVLKKPKRIMEKTYFFNSNGLRKDTKSIEYNKILDKNNILLVANTILTEEKLRLINEKAEKEGKKKYVQDNAKTNIMSGKSICIPDDYTC